MTGTNYKLFLLYTKLSNLLIKMLGCFKNSWNNQQYHKARDVSNILKAINTLYKSPIRIFSQFKNARRGASLFNCFRHFYASFDFQFITRTQNYKP